jgi:hypothetical protein
VPTRAAPPGNADSDSGATRACTKYEIAGSTVSYRALGYLISELTTSHDTSCPSYKQFACAVVCAALNVVVPTSVIIAAGLKEAIEAFSGLHSHNAARQGAVPLTVLPPPTLPSQHVNVAYFVCVCVATRTSQPHQYSQPYSLRQNPDILTLPAMPAERRGGEADHYRRVRQEGIRHPSACRRLCHPQMRGQHASNLFVQQRTPHRLRCFPQPEPNTPACHPGIGHAMLRPIAVPLLAATSRSAVACRRTAMTVSGTVLYGLVPNAMQGWSSACGLHVGGSWVANTPGAHLHQPLVETSQLVPAVRPGATGAAHSHAGPCRPCSRTSSGQRKLTAGCCRRPQRCSTSSSSSPSPTPQLRCSS